MNFRKEPLLVDVELPKEAVINICGDIHGQFYDLIKVLKLRGNWIILISIQWKPLNVITLGQIKVITLIKWKK